MKTFKDLGLSEDLVKALAENGIVNPTDIQDQTIPKLMQSSTDFIGLAQTGTGKTIAFGMPLIEQTDSGANHIQAVVLAPTRELAQQIGKELVGFSKYRKGLKVEVVFGGASVEKQSQSVKKNKPNILVATPGRLIDFIKRKLTDLSRVDHVVLDEADEMLNMGFQEEIDKILSFTPKEKRIWLFSATMPKEIRKVVNKYMVDPVEVSVKGAQETNENIEHCYVLVKRQDKLQALRRIIDFHRDFYGLVFCRTKREAQEVAQNLGQMGYPIEALHGDLSQSQRDNVMRRFRQGLLKIVIATDVAARGIDVDNLTHVIHFHLPDDRAYYTHRSGRTARAGKKGISVAIITPGDDRRIKMLQSHLKIQIQKVELPSKNELLDNRIIAWAENLISGPQPDIPSSLTTSGYELLSGISKEQLIDRLIALEIGKQLNEREEQDLNLSTKDRRSGNKERSGKERRKNGKEKSANNSISNGKGSGDSNQHRYFINIGRIDKIGKSDLIHFICQQARLNHKDIGSVTVMEKHSYFNVDKKHSRKISSSFKGVQMGNRSLRVNRDGQ